MTVVSERLDALGADGAPVRLGIMGGTFDPIHIGHLASAEQAREAFGLDAVVFVPAANPVYKKNMNVTNAADRLAMCKLAVAGNDAFDVSDIEIRRGGDTYTVDTLREMRAHYPKNVELFFITGADAVLSIMRWRESSAIAELATLIAVTRPGYALTDEKRRELAACGNFTVKHVEATALSVSSSDLRARVRAGKSIRYLTPDDVLDYVEANGLYRISESDEALSDEFFSLCEKRLKKRLKPKRFAHSLAVSEMAESLARVYSVDVRRARLAGLLHDWDKDYDDAAIAQRALDLQVKVDPAVLASMPRLLHGPTAAVALHREFPCIDEEILSAISRHTTAAVDMGEMDMVVYIADVIEPTRIYGDLSPLREAVGKVSLEELFFRTFEYVFASLLERGKTLHPDTTRIWNHYATRMR